MVHIVITGATGNVGTSVIESFAQDALLARDAGGPLRLGEFTTGIGQRP